MPMHDWTKVEAGICHAFHHEWISEISRALNRNLLPKDYYALPEQLAAGYGPDVLTLQVETGDDDEPDRDWNGGGVATAVETKLQSPPRTRFIVDADGGLKPRKKSAVAVRDVSDDRLIAMVEIVSRGNKSGRKAFSEFVNKTCELLERRLHLLIVDPFPPGPRDPNGIHTAVWEEFQNDEFRLPSDKSLTMVAYECNGFTRAYIEPIAIGDSLPEMPLFLQPDGCVMVPLEATYQSAFEAMPQRWRKVL